MDTVRDVVTRHAMATLAEQMDRVFMNNSTFEAERRVEALYASVGQVRTCTILPREEPTRRLPFNLRRG